MNKIVHSIPNILSTFRLLLACFFPFAREQEWIWLIVAGGASDFLDGWIARKWKMESWQGGLLDAIADKIFVLSVLITFALADRFSPLWIPGIIARDLTVTVIAAYVIYCRSWAAFKEMGASISGKIATICQFLLFIVVPLLYDYTSYFLFFTALFSILAAFDYISKFIAALKGRKSIQ